MNKNEWLPLHARHLQINSVLERKRNFPLRNRNKIDDLIKEFLDNLGNDIHYMICDYDVEAEAEDYDGLDSDRNTEAEVETAIRFFPNVLTRRKEVTWWYIDDDEDDDDEDDEDGELLYPIQLLPCYCDADENWKCNVKAVSFVPTLAKLAIEFGSFEEEERGGLLCQDYDGGDNILQELMYGDHIEGEHRGYYEHAVDDVYLQVLIKLRKMDLLKKEDILRFVLLPKLCEHYYYFSEKRFRFLVEWNPTALTQPCFGYLPLHRVTNNPSIRRFQLLLEYGIRYFPEKKGVFYCEENQMFYKNYYHRHRRQW